VQTNEQNGRREATFLPKRRFLFVSERISKQKSMEGRDIHDIRTLDEREYC